MARPKSFDPQDAMARIADAFIAHGYEGTSLSRLNEACGLGKQSLYDTFGDKKAMYLRAVDCAVERFAAVRADMAAAPDGRAALALFFERLVRDCGSGDPRRQACIVSAGLLEGIDEADIRERLQSKWLGTHALLLEQVERGQRDGSIARDPPAHDLADHLMAGMSGLRVVARTQPGTARLRRVVALMLSVLDPAEARRG